MNQTSEGITLQGVGKGLLVQVLATCSYLLGSLLHMLLISSDLAKVRLMILHRASQRSTTSRKWQKELGTKLISEYLNNPQVNFFINHWDGKIVKYQDGTVEVLIVLLLQAVGSDVPPQFTGALIKVPNGTGAAMKDGMIE